MKSLLAQVRAACGFEPAPEPPRSASGYLPLHGEAIGRTPAGLLLHRALERSEPSADFSQMRGYVERAAGKQAADYATRNAQFLQDPRYGFASVQEALKQIVAQDILGLPEKCAGFFTGSGTKANQDVFAEAARHCREHGRLNANRIVCSQAAHRSVYSQVDTRHYPLARLALDEDKRMSKAALLSQLDDTTMLLVLSAGSTDFGRMDAPLSRTSTGQVCVDPEILERCAQHKIWLHVDAAWGGFAWGAIPEAFLERIAMCAKEEVEAFKALVKDPRVSSISTCLHKFIGATGCSLVLLPNETESHSLESNYFGCADSRGGTTLPAAAMISAYETLQHCGLDGIQYLALSSLRSAQQFDRMALRLGLAAIVPSSANMATVRLRSKEETLAVRDLLVERGISVSTVLSESGDCGLRLVFSPELATFEGSAILLALEVRAAISQYRRSLGEDSALALTHELHQLRAELLGECTALGNQEYCAMLPAASEVIFPKGAPSRPFLPRPSSKR